MDIGSAVGREKGVKEEQLRDLGEYRTSPHFSEVERLALRLADAMAGAPAEVPLDLYQALRGHLDEAQLVELASAIALENFRARFNRVFRIEPNSLYCPVEGHAVAGGSGHTG